ncbi:hypothetical protein [Chryseosolibacter indicus]|uniref:Uncharacterized protein n=1 Tax=Chryseosolibacter indicus TaxID=2782351 RepID=A0ABS5VYA9_9BACT|nr:hypothetical protein [Chryseosolibacter indicus]MBT1705832.1 hypothetical protein [Chryseosolibacter indicus]
MRWWTYRRYRLWVINTDKETFLYKWDNWKLLMPSIEKLLTLTKEKAFIKTSQSFKFENKWLAFGRMPWSEESNIKWTTKYRTSENESRLQFYDTEIWAPDWNEVDRSNVPPDIYIKLYNLGFKSIQEGLIIAIPRRIAVRQKELIESELTQLTKLIPNSTQAMITRLWYPWWRFNNQIQDMNPQELEMIINEGDKFSHK